LSTIEHFGTVITGITNTILIFIKLVRVGYVRAVIFEATQTVVISIYTCATERSFKREDREVMSCELSATPRCAIITIPPASILRVLPGQHGVSEVEVMTWTLFRIT